ncbi:MAG: radical SAM protein [Desulfobaccales bacterium]
MSESGPVRGSSSSALSRLAGLVQRNPWAAWSLINYQFQNNLGVRLNRRLYPEKSLLPSYISLNPTRRCNLKCRMCIQHRHSPEQPADLPWYRPDQELPLEVWTHLLEELTGWRPILFITGGEPLLYPHILELIEAAKKRRLLVHLQTNGLLLEKVAEDLVALGVEMVTVSIDGPPAVHDYIRGPGTFERSARGLAALQSARERRPSPGPMVDIRCTISQDNVAALGEMPSVALELGVDLLQFTHTIFLSADLVAHHNRLLSPAWAEAHDLCLIQPSIPEGEYYESGIGPETISILLAGVQEVKIKAGGRLRVRFSPNLPLSLIEPYYLDLKYPFPQVCRSLWRSCRILPDGTVSPCLHLVMGNITREPLAEIWNNTRMQSLRKIIAQRLLPGCARCCQRGFT